MEKSEEIVWNEDAKPGKWAVKSFSCTESDGKRAFSLTGNYLGTANPVYVSAWFSEKETVPAVEIDVFTEGMELV